MPRSTPSTPPARSSSSTAVSGQAEAELIHNVLLEEGIPSEVRPSTIASALQAAHLPMVSFSVFVHESGLDQARFVLGLDG